MRYLKLHFIFIFCLGAVSLANAQTPPKLVDINLVLNNNSNPPTVGLNEDVKIELIFDSAMDPTVTPGIQFGLSESNLLDLNFSNTVWSGQVWQGTFTVTKNLPSTPDGEYIFEIFGARNTIGIEMGTTSSLGIGAQDSTLFICRSGSLELDTSSLSFDTLAFGKDQVLSFTVSNVSCEILRVNSIIVPSPFVLFQSPGQFQLPSGTNISVSIKYEPLSRTKHTGTIIINSDDIYQNAHFLEVTGAAAGPQIRVVPDFPLEFGTLEIGEDSTQSIYVINEKAPQPAFSAPLEVNNILINTDAYKVDTTQFVVQPGDSQEIKITFAPIARGLFNNSLQISNNDLQSQVAVVFLKGRGGDDSIPQKPVNLAIKYGTFERFVNEPEFEVCWENPEDPVGITELWWKFSQERNPPVSATDTTQSGGRFIFGDETCATLQLAGNVTPGLWRIYFWLVDAEQNSGYENYTTRVVYYDPTAPVAPPVIGRSIPGEQWFGSGDDFEITIQIPGDPVTGHKDANQVRWKYKTEPGFSRDFNDRYFFNEGDGAEVTFSVPFNLTSLCGEDNLYIWLADSAGNVDFQATTAVPYRFDICSGFVTDFEVTWPNFSGHTNQNTLPICWTPAPGAEEISEIWWKYTQTPTPPQNNSDTTAIGGRIVLDESVSCVNLPLTGSISSGQWYAYVWAVLANGSRASFADPISVNFIYDLKPPAAPQISSNTIPDTAWIANADTFEITVTLPVEPDKTTSDVSELRWKFKSPPVTDDDYVSRHIFNGGSTLLRTAPIPFDSPEFCGDDLLYIWFADSAGNSSLSNITGVRYRFDICSPEITPVIAKSNQIVLLGEAFSDTVIVGDIAGLDSVWAEYRIGGSSNSSQLLLTEIPGTDRFTFEISPDLLGKRGLEYRILAKDARGNVGSGPLVGNSCSSGDIWISVQTRIEGDGDFRVDSDGLPVPLLAGDEQSFYQLFSVPYEVEQNDILSVFQDDLGKYRRSDWRLLDYNPDRPENERYLEGEDARPFIPGRAYFLITKQVDIIVDTGPVTTTKTVCPDSIRLFEGWNLIATPFNFLVSKQSLSLVNSSSPIVLQKYNFGWTEVDAIGPWRGYALFVTADAISEPIYLVVQPEAVEDALAKKATNTLNGDEWQIQISGRAGRLHDLENWVGVRSNAAEGFDNFERAEPPVVGSYLKIMIPQKNWHQSTSEFSSDFRPMSEGELTWEFEVQTNVSGSVELSFDFQGDVPATSEIYLIDEAYNLSQNLRNTPIYRFNASSADISKKLKIIAGDLDYVETQAGSVNLLPQTFELMQNFPNPFNPETSIRFNLPTAATVNLEIFDLLGRKVATLIDNEQRAPGFYIGAWNGRDKAGLAVASGVYIYRLQASGKTFSRKMILLK